MEMVSAENRVTPWWAGQLKQDWKFATLVSSAFFLLALVGVLRHELWSDEIMFWMMARDNQTLSELVTTLRFEYMHPWLWGILLYGISRFTRDPVAMQVLHILIATANVFLLCRFAPLPRWQKLLLSFSYFLFYEYSIISRNYGFGVLVIFLFCTLFPTRKQRYWVLAGILALMANVNFFSRLTAIALAAMLAVEWLRDRRQEKAQLQPWDIILSVLIFAVGMVLSVVQNIPPVHSGGVGGFFPGGGRLGLVVSAIATVWKSYFPMPGIALRFWNSNLIDDGFAAALSWIPLGFSIALFYRRPLILFLYLFNLTEIVLFHSLWAGLLRHYGHIFILFIVCLWLAQNYTPEPTEAPAPRNPVWRFFQRYQSQFLGVVLAVQVIAGFYAYTMDWVHPFSQARLVAQFVRQENLQNYFIAGAIDSFTQSVSGHLDQPIFYPERKRLGTYISSDNRAERLNSQLLLARVAEAATSDQALLVLNKPLDTPIPTIPNWGIQPLPGLQPAIVKVENYYLYLFQRLR
ncbi:MAG: hypothetical protein NW224_25105 [Leptolyngbyaceae cyanobacterium bins.302]|nr:hypothetical protein [Leptolyngbyaceae cyanobacterium bins.302]